MESEPLTPNAAPDERPRRVGRHALVLVALLVAACGGTVGPTVRAPMTSAESAFFDGAVEYVVDPMALGGTFAERASASMAGLVAYADFIAVARVRAVRTDRDAQGHRTMRLVVAPTRVLRGAYAPSELVLSAREDEAGFDSIAGHEAQLLGTDVLVFVRWAHDADRRVVPRFHVAPASGPVTSDVINRVRSTSAP